jgi:predicted nuclease of restriction endonuclease-like RecB superfamily
LLKSELVQARLEIRGGQVRTRTLAADYRYLTIASELMALFRRHVGRSRGMLAEAVRDYFDNVMFYFFLVSF